jgi:hypothetical protein
MDGPSSQRKYTRFVRNIIRRHCVCHLSLVTVLLVVCNKSNAKFCVLLNQAMIENISCNRINPYAQDTTARQSSLFLTVMHGLMAVNF